MQADKKNNIAVLRVILLAALLSALSFYLQYNIDINLADEGYLLYGALQTAAGNVPIRDFQAYDPGRYYWMAAWSFLFGDGLMAMRLSLAIFGGMGLCFGLLAARRVIRSFIGLVPLGVLFTIWIFPRYHSFEITFAFATVFFATRLIERPSRRRYFTAGIFVGLAAFFGRNLGFYGFMAISVTALYLWLRLKRVGALRRYACFIGGVTLGYSPIFFMALFVPGFFSAFIESILFYIRLGATNLPLPVPWPWRIISSGASGFLSFYYLSLGILFLVMPLFYLLCFLRLFFIIKEDTERYALLTASLFTGLFYMHYVFSRADIEHLAHGIPPLALAIVAFAALWKPGWGRKTLILCTAVFLLFASYFTVLKKIPFYKKNIAWKGSYVEYNIRGESVWLNRGQVMSIKTIEQAVRNVVPAEDALLIAPFIPTMYYILQRQSPTWDIYFILGGSSENQSRIIASLKEHNVKWAVVSNVPLDGRDELRFSRSYDMVWAYLRRNYVMLVPLQGTGYVLIHKREEAVPN